MTQNIYSVPVGGFSAEELSHMQSRLNGGKENAPYFTPKGMTSGRQEVNVVGGKVVSVVSQDKTFGVPTHYITEPKPGFISIPGLGETTVAAAKAGGLIPHTWKEGDALPFDKVPGTAKAAAVGGDAEPAEGKSGDLSVAEHRAKVAGQILDKVDQTHGAAVTDRYINAAVDTGEIPVDGLPQGVTPTMVQQVVAGYIAQADSVLAPVGASVALLQELLDDNELRRARQSTLAGMKSDLAQLGQIAVERLARLPETDPEGFQEMVDGMTAKDRAMLRRDKSSGVWMVRAPGHPEMSFAAAVSVGLVRV